MHEEPGLCGGCEQPMIEFTRLHWIVREFYCPTCNSQSTWWQAGTFTPLGD